MGRQGSSEKMVNAGKIEAGKEEEHTKWMDSIKEAAAASVGGSWAGPEDPLPRGSGCLSPLSGTTDTQRRQTIKMRSLISMTKYYGPTEGYLPISKIKRWWLVDFFKKWLLPRSDMCSQTVSPAPGIRLCLLPLGRPTLGLQIGTQAWFPVSLAGLRNVLMQLKKHTHNPEAPADYL